MNKVLALCIVLNLIFSDPAGAFEVGRFHSGMSEDEALAIARAINPKALIEPLRGDPTRSTLSFVDLRMANNSRIYWGISFCKTELVEVTKTYTSLRWDFLSQAVSQLNEVYGYGKVKPYKNGEEGSEPEVHGLILNWESTHEDVNILLQSIIYKENALAEKMYIYENYKSKKYEQLCF